jgi:hypothetical protein
MDLPTRLVNRENRQVHPAPETPKRKIKIEAVVSLQIYLEEGSIPLIYT